MSHNNSKIPEKILRKLMRLIEANTERIIEEWIEHFEEVRFFC